MHVLLLSLWKQSIKFFFVFNLRICKLCNCGGNNNGDKYDKGRLTNEMGNRSTTITPACIVIIIVIHAVRRGKSRGV